MGREGRAGQTEGERDSIVFTGGEVGQRDRAGQASEGWGSGDSIELYRMYGEVGGGITPNSTHT